MIKFLIWTLRKRYHFFKLAFMTFICDRSLLKIIINFIRKSFIYLFDQNMTDYMIKYITLYLTNNADISSLNRLLVVK